MTSTQMKKQRPTIDENYIPKEISWLAFNERVLQEGADKSVPLIERMKFLGIYSSNMDEFFRVRVATLKRLIKLGPRATQFVGHDPMEVLHKVQKIVVAQHRHYNGVFEESLHELAENHIHFVDENQLDAAQESFVQNYFSDKVRTELSPTIFNKTSKLPELEDGSIYLAIIMVDSVQKHKNRYALMEVPTRKLPRFTVLPKRSREHYIIFLDDIIRYSMKDIFHFFPHNTFTAFTIKISRDAELDLDDDIAESYVQKMSKSLHQRLTASPVRFVYDERIPNNFLEVILNKLKITNEDTLIPGSRYHNRSDFIQFPKLGSPRLNCKKIKPVLHKGFQTDGRLTDKIKKCDLLLHVPYNPFSHFLTFLRETAIDPKVKEIKITLYRLGKVSSIVSALRNAIRNGKNVSVILELQARFDEKANIKWGDVLQDAGAKVIFGVPGLKVHSKLCLVSRQEGKKIHNYAVLGTGNFNEDTASIYEDLFLFTARSEITSEVKKVFQFFQKNYIHPDFNHLIVSPFNCRKKIAALINREIEYAKQGKKARIVVKKNHLGDYSIIDQLYNASQHGVEVILIIRTMFCALPKNKNQIKNFRSLGVVDNFLEHSRFMVFYNDGDPKYYLGSGDWLPRNFDKRVEVLVPVLDQTLRTYLDILIKIYLKDNSKARVWDRQLTNAINTNDLKRPYKAQTHIYKYLKHLHS